MGSSHAGDRGVGPYGDDRDDNAGAPAGRPLIFAGPSHDHAPKSGQMTTRLGFLLNTHNRPPEPAVPRTAKCR